MAGNIFSPSWHRVSGLTPTIRGHVRIHRHRYRGKIWYVLQDLSTERFHRFSAAAYLVIGLMDGVRTVREIWEQAVEKLGDHAPTQNDMITLLSQLHAADALQCDVAPDVAELFHRHQTQRRRVWQGRLLSVLAWKIPLFDPERFLSHFQPLARPLFGWWGLLLWLGALSVATVLAGIHWTDLTRNVLDLLVTPQGLLSLWLLFPVLKALHELGHGFAVKAFGGEVHDMGLMVLVFMPVPYVDASAASALSNKWQRIAVGAAGIMVELFVASLALFLWLAVEPGWVRTLAYHTMLLGSVSTVLFNANPLLRYDGYYMLGDFLEIPNLGPRSSAYVGYLCERYLFGQREVEPPESSAGERCWFLAYALASFGYRMVVIAAILVFIAGRFFGMGAAFAIAAVIGWLVVPLMKGVVFLFGHPRLRRVRLRAVAVTVTVVTLLLGFIFLVPLPLRTYVEGVVWMPDESIVRAGSDGFVMQVVARDGARVRRGDPLIIGYDPELAAQLKVLAAKVRELEIRYREQWSMDVVKAGMIQDELRFTTQRLARAREQTQELIIRSRADGTFVAPRAESLPGRFVKRGETLGHIVELDRVTVRAVLSQSDLALIQERTGKIEIRLAEQPAESVSAAIKRIVPAATEELPSAALGSAGGGKIAVDPLDSRGLKALEKLFQIDLELPRYSRLVNVGGRVYVRSDHGWEPIYARGYRYLRRLFLSHFYA